MRSGRETTCYASSGNAPSLRGLEYGMLCVPGNLDGWAVKSVKLNGLPGGFQICKKVGWRRAAAARLAGKAALDLHQTCPDTRFPAPKVGDGVSRLANNGMG